MKQLLVFIGIFIILSSFSISHPLSYYNGFNEYDTSAPKSINNQNHSRIISLSPQFPKYTIYDTFPLIIDHTLGEWGKILSQLDSINYAIGNDTNSYREITRAKMILINLKVEIMNKVNDDIRNGKLRRDSVNDLKMIENGGR